MGSKMKAFIAWILFTVLLLQSSDLCLARKSRSKKHNINEEATKVIYHDERTTGENENNFEKLLDKPYPIYGNKISENLDAKSEDSNILENTSIGDFEISKDFQNESEFPEISSNYDQAFDKSTESSSVLVTENPTDELEKDILAIIEEIEKNKNLTENNDGSNEGFKANGSISEVDMQASDDVSNGELKANGSIGDVDMEASGSSQQHVIAEADPMMTSASGHKSHKGHKSKAKNSAHKSLKGKKAIKYKSSKKGKKSDKKGHYRKAEKKKKADKKGKKFKSSKHKKKYHGDLKKSKKGKKSFKHGSKGHHKKGHKDKGYKNIYHKEEYSRKKKFYDDKDLNKHHDKKAKGKKSFKGNRGKSQKGSNKKGIKYSDEFSKKAEDKKGIHYDKKSDQKNKFDNKKYKQHKAKHGKKSAYKGDHDDHHWDDHDLYGWSPHDNHGWGSQHDDDDFYQHGWDRKADEHHEDDGGKWKKGKDGWKHNHKSWEHHSDDHHDDDSKPHDDHHSDEHDHSGDYSKITPVKVLPLHDRHDKINETLPSTTLAEQRPRLRRDRRQGRPVRPRHKRKPFRKYEPNDNYYENDHRGIIISGDYNKNHDSSDYPYNENNDGLNHSAENTGTNGYHEELELPLPDYSEKSQHSPSENINHDEPQLGKHPIHKNINTPVYSARYSNGRHDDSFQPIVYPSPHGRRYHESHEAGHVHHHPVSEETSANDFPYYSEEQGSNDAPYRSKKQGSKDTPYYYDKTDNSDVPYYYKNQENKNVPYYSKKQDSNAIVKHPKKPSSIDVPYYHLKTHQPNDEPYNPDKQSSDYNSQKIALPSKKTGYVNSPFNFNTFGDFLVPKFA